MAVGLPVVATRVGGLPELVSDDAGVLVDADDAEALAEAIVRLARDPSLRTRMGAAGRERIAREFTLERQADGVHRAYLDTLARDGGSATAHAARDRGR
jgi:glycosyltransferase involved in cell wall biosynthesis